MVPDNYDHLEYFQKASQTTNYTTFLVQISSLTISH